jgi:hypothetical protein
MGMFFPLATTSRPGMRSLCPNRTIRNWTGAPRSPQRTWAELFFSNAFTDGRPTLDPDIKALAGASPHLCRPRYAGANLGHPSSS